MSIMRGDGNFMFYQVQCLHEDEGDDWHEAGDVFFAKIPQELRFIEPRLGKATPLFTEYNDTWQTHGHHGWTDPVSARDVMQLLARYNPGHRFRVVCLRVRLCTTSIAEMICREDSTGGPEE